ncbi:MAG: hypothetical protein ABSH48_19060, partial [Verrucomicrobiota bacterium]
MRLGGTNRFTLPGTAAAVFGCAAATAQIGAAAIAPILAAAATPGTAPDATTNAPPAAPLAPPSAGAGTPQNWNIHVQNTDIVQGYPGFSANYSGPNSLPSGGEVRETFSFDVMGGVRLWSGAEAHVDGLMWQGFGLRDTLGAEGFPNGEAFRLGTDVPNGALTRLFI